METQALAVRDDKAVNDFITQAIEQKLPVESLERLFALRERVKAEAAREAYTEDMAKLQGELPIIAKSKTARDESKGKDLYRFAPIDDIVSQTKHIIAKHGFSYAFLTENTADKVKVTCIVTHKFGHSKESIMETGLATKTFIMSGPQQIASTVTFNKRYAFCNAFGITTGDEDTDAAGEQEAQNIGSVETYRVAVDAAKTLIELRAVWATIPKPFQVALEARKEELKGILK